MSDFIKTKSSMCLALYHLGGLSCMLCVTDTAFCNPFKGLMFMVSASPSATRAASLEETAAQLGQRREKEEPTQVSRTVTTLSWCLAPDTLPFPHEGACPLWIPLLGTYGSRSCTTTSTTSSAVWGAWFADKSDAFWSDALGSCIFPVTRLLFLFRKLWRHYRAKRSWESLLAR